MSKLTVDELKIAYDILVRAGEETVSRQLKNLIQFAFNGEADIYDLSASVWHSVWDIDDIAGYLEENDCDGNGMIKTELLAEIRRCGMKHFDTLAYDELGDLVEMARQNLEARK